MAISNASGTYYYVTIPVLDYPFSLLCRGIMASSGDRYEMVAVVNSNGNYNAIGTSKVGLKPQVSTRKVTAPATYRRAAKHSTIMSTIAWTSIGGTFLSRSDRGLWVQGVYSAGDVTGAHAWTHTVLSIGSAHGSAATEVDWAGVECEVGVYAVGLTHGHYQQAHLGLPLNLISPGNLLYWFRLVNNGDLTCRVSGLTLAVSGSPASEPHAPVFDLYPRRAMPAAPAATVRRFAVDGFMTPAGRKVLVA